MGGLEQRGRWLSECLQYLLFLFSPLVPLPLFLMYYMALKDLLQRTDTFTQALCTIYTICMHSTCKL